MNVVSCIDHHELYWPTTFLTNCAIGWGFHMSKLLLSISWAYSNSWLHHGVLLSTSHLIQQMRLERWFPQGILHPRVKSRWSGLIQDTRRLEYHILLGARLTHLHIAMGKGGDLWTPFNIIFHNPPHFFLCVVLKSRWSFLTLMKIHG